MGEVGYLVASIKQLADVKVGDTITHALTHNTKPATEMLKGFKEIQPVVFAGIFPTNSDDFENLRNAMDKLRLNDSSFTYEPETSQALGFGFRCGFLGLLHMEIVQERLEREFDLDLITTAPSVRYHVYLTDGDEDRRGQPRQAAAPARRSRASRSPSSRPRSSPARISWAACSSSARSAAASSSGWSTSPPTA